MLKNAALVMGAIAVLALVGGAIYYFQLTAPVQISDKPPLAATLVVVTTPAPPGTVAPVEGQTEGTLDVVLAPDESPVRL